MLEQFEEAWRSRNHGKKDTLHTEIQSLLSALDRERKRSRVVLAICSWYTFGTAIVSAFVFANKGQLRLAEVWPLVAAQILALLVLGYLWRANYRRPLTAALSIRESAESAFAAIQTRLQTMKLVAITMAVILVLSGFAIASLVDSGKMNAKAVSSMATIFALIVVCNGSILWWKWKRKLRPQQERLTEILRDLAAH